METFDLHDVTAILPDADGSCLVAQSREVRRLVPYALDPHRLEIRTSMIVRTMECIASHDNDRKYIQLTSGGNWYQGYDATERYAATYEGTGPYRTVQTYVHYKANQFPLHWSHYHDVTVQYLGRPRPRVTRAMYCAAVPLQRAVTRRLSAALPNTADTRRGGASLSPSLQETASPRRR